MLLYHGTSERLLKKILKEGLKPRGKRSGNWKHSIESNPKSVYLTDSYPAYFAFAVSKGNERGIVLEIDTENIEDYLRADEDVLEQVGRDRDNVPGDMIERTRIYRKKAEFNPNWELSLEIMGTCGCYHAIDPSSIKRYCVIDWKRVNHNIRGNLIDTQVSVMNYNFLAHRHRSLTQWLMGRDISVDDVEPLLKAGGDQFKALLDHLEQALSQRTGVEIHDLSLQAQ